MIQHHNDHTKASHGVDTGDTVLDIAGGHHNGIAVMIDGMASSAKIKVNLFVVGFLFNKADNAGFVFDFVVKEIVANNGLIR